MRTWFIFLAIIFCSTAHFSQKPDDILATATGHTFKVSDLSPQTRSDIASLPQSMETARVAILNQLISQRVYEAEAAAKGISVGQLIKETKSQAPDPGEVEIKAVIDANQDKLGGMPPDEARRRVIAYLRGAPEQKAIADLSAKLQTKYKVTPGKSVNATPIGPNDIVVTINGKPVTYREFQEFARLPLYDATADLSDLILGELNELIYNTLITDEAKALSLDTSTLIAREVTNKMKDFTDAERISLSDSFKERLYNKYQVKIVYKEPPAPVQIVPLADSPSKGSATAPVTIVMFSDFQCSACSATHPVLKKAMEAYPGKIRFVVRDFPLETLHENAYRAALAAGAANAQGKFFEFIEVLYAHQNALDDASLKKYASDLGLNAKQFEIDFNSEKVASDVKRDMADGNALGISATPTIFVNGVMVRNISEYGFKTAIDKALKK